MTLKIAWSSNAPFVGSGYGMATAEITRKLKASGHEVTILANHGLAGSTIQWEGIPVFPQGIDAYSNDLHPAAMLNVIGDQRHRGLGITLFDVWVYKNPQWDDVPLLSWTPVDHAPAVPEVIEFFNRPGRKWALAMSRFGEEQLLAAGISRDRVFYSPHTFNPALFRPDGDTMREQMNVPADAHLTMVNAANKGNTPIRKCFPEVLYAWSRFAERHEDAYLYLHTELTGIASGVRLDRLLAAVKAPRDRVRVVPQYEYRMGIDHATVARLYRSSDVLLATARGEGFGVPTIEAQASGIPVIVTDWTASPELVGAGWKVDGQIDWDEFQGSWWKVPSIDGIVDALEQSYKLKGDEALRAKTSETAVAFASQYTTDRVYEEHWVPLLARMEDLLGKPAATVALNREQRRQSMRKAR
jgi:glycosyltransferase involved in cell wall biosynthesis